MIEIDQTLLVWIKSSRSTENNCVEVAYHGWLVLVRDSHDRAGPVLTFKWQAWRALLTDLPSRENG